MVEVQIISVEHRSIDQPLQIEDMKLLALQLDHPVAPKFLKRPVDVDRGQSGRVGEVVLGQREVAAPIVRPPNRPQPYV